MLGAAYHVVPATEAVTGFQGKDTACSTKTRLQVAHMLHAYMPCFRSNAGCTPACREHAGEHCTGATVPQLHNHNMLMLVMERTFL
jgi:hypothetical protein